LPRVAQDLKKTLVGLNEFPTEGRNCTSDFMVSALSVNYGEGKATGWDTFGP